MEAKETHMTRSMSSRAAFALTLAIVPVVAGAGTALAHHPTGGQMPTTLWHGLLSGLGHPVIGPDHLAFIVAIGIAAAFARGGLGIVATFMMASTAGVLVHVANLDLPMAEPMVALSVVLAGGAIAAGFSGSRPLWLVLAAAAGLFHGYAFGETVVGAERGVIGAYLVGLALVQGMIAAGIMQFTGIYDMANAARSVHLRTAGAILAAIGIVMLAGGLASA